MNTILTSDLVTQHTMFGFNNNLKFGSKLTRELNEDFKSGNYTAGDTVQARLPNRFVTNEGQALQTSALLEQKVPVTLEKQFQVATEWSSREATTDIREERERYIDPMADSLANKVDVYAYNKIMLQIPNAVGTPGTSPSTPLTYLTAGTLLTNGSVPKGGRIATLAPIPMATIANAGTTLFNPASVISEQYREGIQAMNTLGISEWWEEPNVGSYTTGTFTASTPVVNGANQTGTSLITSGWANGATTLNQGDSFTIANVFMVNPLSYTNTGTLQPFLVTQTISDTAGAITFTISPSIITSGPLQTVSASPANSAAITVKGATSAVGGTLAATLTLQNLVFTKDVGTLVSADLKMPKAGVETSRIRSKQWGISLRMVEGYDISTDQMPTRIDFLCGAALLQARFGVRVYA